MPPVKISHTLPSGKVIDLYYVGSLASALGRTSLTIRKWEISGVIPTTCFKDSLGRRLYSQEMINLIVDCAEKAQIKQGSSLSDTCFTKLCTEGLEKLRKKYFRK